MPPLTQPELRQAYINNEKAKEEAKQNQRTYKLSRVVGMWQARVSWWNTDFDYEALLAKKRKEEEEKKKREEEERERQRKQEEERQRRRREEPEMEKKECKSERQSDELCKRRSKSKAKKCSAPSPSRDMAARECAAPAPCADMLIEEERCSESISLDCNEASMKCADSADAAPAQPSASIQLKAWDVRTPVHYPVKARAPVF